MPGVLLCFLASQAHRRVLLWRLARQELQGLPWVGSYSVVQCIMCLMGQPLYCSAANAGMWGERGYGDGLPCDSAVSPCFHGCLPFLHHHFLPQSPPQHPLNPSVSVNSSPRPGIAPHSLNSSSQPLCLPGDQHSCPRYVWLQQGLSDSHSI